MTLHCRFDQGLVGAMVLPMTQEQETISQAALQAVATEVAGFESAHRLHADTRE